MKILLMVTTWILVGILSVAVVVVYDAYKLVMIREYHNCIMIRYTNTNHTYLIIIHYDYTDTIRQGRGLSAFFATIFEGDFTTFED